MPNINDLFPYPPFDPKAKCAKCGYEIPEPVAPTPKVTAGGVAQPAEPKPPADPPITAYCNGDVCPWDDEHAGSEEHLHQFCEICGYEWVSQPLG